MGGLSSFLFGDKPSADISSRTLLTKEQQDALNSLIGTLSGSVGGPGPSAPTAPTLNVLPTTTAPNVSVGATSAPLNAGQATSLTGLEEAAKNIGSGQAFNDSVAALTQLAGLFNAPQTDTGAKGAVTDIFGQGSSGSSLVQNAQPILDVLRQSPTANPGLNDAMAKLLAGQNQGFDQYFNDAVMAPMLKKFQLEILPQISRKYTGNFFGSERALADRLAQSDLLDSLTSQRANLAYNTQKDALDRMLSAAGIATTANTATQGNELSAILGAGQQQTATGNLAVAQQNLDQAVKANDRATSIQALSQLTNVPTQQVDSLVKTMEASGLPLDQSITLSQLILGQQQAGGSLGLTAAGQNLQGATAQNQQAIDLYNSLANIFGIESGTQNAQLQALVQAILTPTKENIATVTGGSSGLLSGVGAGIGEAGTLAALKSFGLLGV